MKHILPIFICICISLFANWLTDPLAPNEERLSALQELPYHGDIQWEIRCDGAPKAALCLYDIIGRPLETHELHTLSGTLRPSPLAASVALLLKNDTTDPLQVESASVKTITALRNFVEADWIWDPTLGTKTGAYAIFRNEFQIDNPDSLSSAFLYITADDRVVTYLNDTYLEGPHSGGYDVSDSFAVLDALKHGTNTLVCRVLNGGGPGGLLCELHLIDKNGKHTVIPSSTKWRCAPVSGEDTNWHKAPATATPIFHAKSGGGPWGKVKYAPVSRITAHLKELNAPAFADENTIWTPTAAIAFADEQNIFTSDAILSIYLKNSKGVDILVADATLKKEEMASHQKSSNMMELHLEPVSFRFIPDGVYALEIRPENATITTEPLQKITVRHTNDAKHCLPQVELVDKEFIPQFLIDGKEKVRITQYLADNALSSKALREEKRALDSGIQTLWIHHQILFDADGNPDFRNIDSKCAAALARNPKACIVINPALDCVQSPQMTKFFEDNPDALCLNSEGGTAIYNDPASTQAVQCPSLASEKWLQEAERLLGLLIEHLESVPYGRRVVAIAPSSGITWEWMYWGSERLDECTDYSPAFRKVFQDYARRKYGSLQDANKAWRRNFTTFDDIAIPSFDERRKRTELEFLNPAEDRYVMDMADCIAEIVSGDIIRLCRFIKEKTQGRTLTAAYYGYYNMITVPRWGQGSGHWALSRVLASDAVDMIQAPSTYIERGPGEPGGFMPPESAIRAAGKVFVTESDIRTHYSTSPLGLCKTLQESRGVLEREFGACLANNVAFRFYDFNLGWVFGDERFAHLASLFAKAEEEILETKPEIAVPRDAIAVIISENSMTHLNYWSPLNSYLVAEQYRKFPRTGVAFKVYITPGLENIPRDHRFWYFENLFRMTPEEFEYIRENVIVPGNTVLFAYGANILTDRGISTQTLTELTGLKFKTDFTRKNTVASLTQEGSETLENAAATGYPATNAYAPKFYPVEGEFKVLARDTDGNALLAETEVNGCRIVFSALHGIQSAWIRSLAKQTGLLCFNDTDGDVTWASGDVITVHSKTGGPRTIRTRHDAGIAKNLLTGEETPVKNGSFSYTARATGTDVFLVK